MREFIGLSLAKSGEKDFRRENECEENWELWFESERELAPFESLGIY